MRLLLVVISLQKGTIPSFKSYQSQQQHPDAYSGLHLYVIRLQLDKITINHRQVFDGLRERGIGVNLHYIPIHTQPYYQRLGFEIGAFPQAERYYKEAISLPLYQGLTDKEQEGLSERCVMC